MEKPDIAGIAKRRVPFIRLRSWAMTVAVVVALVLYYLVSVSFNTEVNIIDLAVLATVQIVLHCIFFPEGEVFGEKNAAYIANKDCYNEKATAINAERKIGKLREYCKHEYAERRETYIENACGAINLSKEEYAYLNTLDWKTIKKAKCIEYDGRMIFLTKHKKRVLHILLRGGIPVEPNSVELILSAAENAGYSAIKDKSSVYKKYAYIRKIIIALCVGTFFAYVGYKTRDGINLAVIAQVVSSVTTLFTTAVLSFSKGETCIKVWKTRFYIDLCNFIDAFNEWTTKEPL